jgi:protein MBA1
MTTQLKAQAEGDLAEDIGLLQDTIVRPSWNKLPKPWKPQFTSFLWKLMKSWATGKYS